jgi:predicted Zn finger-like uncharacterized protein
MFTVCPKCALTLVVTAADLRIAQGYVRCGRCSSVFNALARLSDDRQGTAESEAPRETPLPAPAAPPSAPAEAAGSAPSTATKRAATPAPRPPAPEEAIPDAALEFNPEKTDVTKVFFEAPPDPEWTAATGSFRALIAANQEETEDAQAPAPPAAAAPPDTDGELEVDAAFLAGMLGADQQLAPQPLEPSLVTPVRRAVVPPAPYEPPEAEVAPVDDDEEDAREEEEEPAPAGLARLRPYAWHAGAALAVLLLTAQIFNHYRDELATSARLNRPLTSLYAALGVPLVPRWDLHAYDVRQLGAAVDPSAGGLIMVRASIKNSAKEPQPLPLLRVTLQDRFGNRIAARDVTPSSYLPHAMPPSSFLAGGQRIDAQMGFVDPGSSAVGFEIDACLPAGGGAVACANDTSAR